MRIALIGMSGSGKSFWSQILGRHGFDTFGCDDHIGRRLAAAGEIDHPSLDHLGRWMGFPFEPDFGRRERLYLSIEQTVMDELLTRLEAEPDDGDPGSSLVIDTTGSVIYTGDATMRRLRQQTVVIYLALPPAHRDTLRREYEKRPRPVLWQGHFQQNHGEMEEDALRRCYADLIEARDKLYRHYAHLEILWEPYSRQTPDVATLLTPAAAFLNRQRRSHDS